MTPNDKHVIIFCAFLGYFIKQKLLGLVHWSQKYIPLTLFHVIHPSYGQKSSPIWSLHCVRWIKLNLRLLCRPADVCNTLKSDLRCWDMSMSNMSITEYHHYYISSSIYVMLYQSTWGHYKHHYITNNYEWYH